MPNDNINPENPIMYSTMLDLIAFNALMISILKTVTLYKTLNVPIDPYYEEIVLYANKIFTRFMIMLAAEIKTEKPTQ